MGSKSDYLENKVLDHVLRVSSFTVPAANYVALYTVTPSDAGGGTEVSTGVWTNYARKSATFNAASGGATSNSNLVDFGTATISGGAPTVVAFGLLDASTSGNLLYWGALAVNKTINNGDPVTIPIGDLDITED